MSNVVVSAIVRGASGDVRFRVSTQSDFSSPINSAWVTPDEYGIVKGTVTGLANATSYFLGAEDALGPVGGVEGEFTTSPTGAHSFSFCAGSCSETGSDAFTFERIKDRVDLGEVDFVVRLGDLHYEDIGVNDETLFHDAYRQVLAAPRQDALFRATPVLYIWDDHDYGQNDTDRDSPSKAAAIAAYRARVPTPPLAQATDAPYYSWVRGRVRFIFTDLRSERVPNGTFVSTDSQQAMFTTTQRDWLLGEFDAAAAAGQAVIWVNTIPWIAATTNGADDWGGFDAARQEIADHITTNSLSGRIAILSGDMHALAYDDGTNAAGGVKVMHCAPLDQVNSVKGGPYTVEALAATTQQYGLVDVTDTGTGNISLRFRGISVNVSTGAETVEIDQSFTLTP